MIGVNSYLNSNCTMYLAQTVRAIVYVLKYFQRKICEFEIQKVVEEF